MGPEHFAVLFRWAKVNKRYYTSCGLFFNSGKGNYKKLFFYKLFALSLFIPLLYLKDYFFTFLVDTILTRQVFIIGVSKSEFA